MADRGERMGAGDEERVGRRVHDGLDGGTSRRASMKGSSSSEPENERDAGHGGEFGATDDGTGERGTGGYGASSGFSSETRGAEKRGAEKRDARDDRERNERDSQNRRTGGDELEPGATEARTRTGDVGRQAESGMETRPEEGTGR